MPRLEFVLEVDASVEQVWQFHNTIETLFILTPPHTKVSLEGKITPMQEGAIFRLKMRRMGIPMPIWYAEIVSYRPPCQFVDRQVTGRGPFRQWTHTHQFEPMGANRTRLRDIVEYELPFGILGRLVDRLFIRKDIQRMFAYRHYKTREILTRNASATALAPA